jgi:CRISPR-associated protein Cmr4
VTTNNSFESFVFLGMALDPIHAGAGGTRLGRVDNTIVRDPATRIPKIPGSSLAGVMRAYTAMKNEKYPNCAGQKDHCGKANCPVCTVFGFAKGTEGGFAGLAAFSDMQVLLFPVASQQGPQWITSPMALYQSGIIKELEELPDPHAVYRKEGSGMLNFGWLFLPVKGLQQIDSIVGKIQNKGVQSYITERLCIVSDKLFTHIVNSNLEVRTSVSINPKTGAAEDGALFTYEALPRGTVLSWEITCRNPKHFKINKTEEVEAVNSPDAVKEVVMGAHTYLEHLGIGGMGSRGMGRLRVLSSKERE